MSNEENRTRELLIEALATRNAYRIADRTAKPQYAEYQKAKANNVKRVRQLIKDVRWFGR